MKNFLLTLLQNLELRIPPPADCHHCIFSSRYGSDETGWQEKLTLQINEGGRFYSYFFDDEDLDAAAVGDDEVSRLVDTIVSYHESRASNAQVSYEAATFKPKLYAGRVQLPVLEYFNPKKVIGYIDIYKGAIPDLPTFHFGLGFKLSHNPVRGKGDWELIAIGLQHDSKFKEFKTADGGVVI